MNKFNTLDLALTYLDGENFSFSYIFTQPWEIIDCIDRYDSWENFGYKLAEELGYVSKKQKERNPALYYVDWDKFGRAYGANFPYVKETEWDLYILNDENAELSNILESSIDS